MATEAEDNDTSLGLLVVFFLSWINSVFTFLTDTVYNLLPFDPSGDILQANDDLSKVINSYKKIVEGLPINGDSEEPQSTTESGETFVKI